MPVTIDTTTQISAPGFSGQRKIETTSTGQLWVCHYSLADARFEFWYSDDDGAAWAENTFMRLVADNPTAGSFRIDEADHAHFVFVVASGLPAYTAEYRRKAPVGEVGGWSQQKSVSNCGLYPDLAVHREGSGWVVHIVADLFGSVEWHRFTVTSGGSLGETVTYSTVINAGVACSPSVEFAHVGDGKTSTGTPHVFVVAWSATQVMYRKAVYSAGSWAFSAVRSIDSTTPNTTLRCGSQFDGTRSVIAWVPSGANTTVEVRARDAADTTTTTIADPPALSDGQITGLALTCDAAANIFLAAVGTTSDDPKYVRYDNAAGTWGAWTTIETTTCAADSITVRRAAGYYLDVLYATGASSPFTIRHERVTLNSTPNGAPWVTLDGAYDVAASLELDWVFSDPNPSDTQQSYVLKRDIGGTIRYYRASDQTWQTTEQTNTTATTTVTLASSWGLDGDATHLYYVKTTDAGSLTGPYGPALTVVPSAKSNPTIDEPDPADVISTSSVTTQWTVTDQGGGYRNWVTDDNASNAIVWDSGWVADSVVRQATSAPVLANGGDYTTHLTTKNAEGLTSNEASAAFDVTYVAPATPSLVANDTTNPWITVTVDNPTPGGGQPAIASNDLFVRVAAGGRADGDRPAGGAGVRIAAGIVNDGVYDDYAVASGVVYEYMVRAHGDNGTFADSTWTA